MLSASLLILNFRKKKQEADNLIWTRPNLFHISNMDKDYEIELFGFSTHQASTERKYFIKKMLNAAFDAVLNKIDCSPETSEQLLKLKQNVLLDVWQIIGDHIKSVDALDKKYFSVPDHVLLPASFHHVKMYTEESEKQIDEQIAWNRTRFLENSTMLAYLKTENRRYGNFENFMDDELDVQRQIKECLGSLNTNKIYDLVNKAKEF